MIGTRIGSYEITQQLGQGGMGAVYLAEHARIRTRKVVKVLLPEYSQNEQIVRRFENEAHAAARLNHRNIIKIDDFGRLESGQWYLLMPFLEGSPLDAFLENHGKLSIHEALHILAQISNALHEAHRLGIVHRDLKPGNVFLTQVGDNPRFAMLLDFGIAKVHGLGDGPETQTGAVFGTPAYMAAEQFEDASRADARSDLFALGVIAYQMVTGVLPFGVAPGPVLYNRQITSRPERPAGVPDAWAELLLQTLALHPDRRPASARAFAIALASATPEDPPFEPSGAEILAIVARELVTQAPAEEATVKNHASTDRVAPMLWGPSRAGESNPPAPSPLLLPSHIPSPNGIAVSAPTVVARPGAPIRSSVSGAADITTLSAMAGSQRPSDFMRPRSRRWGRLGGVSAAVLGATILVGWMLRERSDERSSNATSSAATQPTAAQPEPSAAQAPTPASPPPSAPTTAPVVGEPRNEAIRESSSATSELTIDTVPPDAVLVVDGRNVGRAPQLITVPVGSDVEIRATLAGHSPALRTVRVSEPASITLRLQRSANTTKEPRPAAPVRKLPTGDIEEGT